MIGAGPGGAVAGPWWRRHGAEALAIAGLAALAAALLAVSWRKWPDAVIDFGRELYLPWRISHGAVFGREVESLYGPLSAYVNAAVFRVAGPGIMHLALFNLAVWTVLTVTAYLLLRRGWGRAGATAGAGFFVAVFSFVQLTDRGNYNYLTPYAHEAVHGLLACVMLTVVLLKWRRTGAVRWAAAAGFCAGLAAVLKFECLLAALGVTAVAVALDWRAGRRPRWREAACFLVALVAPVVGFTVWFMRFMPGWTALKTAGQAVYNAVVQSRYVGEKVQLTFSGLDAPWLHLKSHLFVTAIVAALLVVIWLGARRAGRELEWESGWRWLGWVIAAVLVGGAGTAGWFAIYGEAGYALIPLVLAAGLVAAWDWEKARRAGAPLGAAEARVLFAALGLLMLARMPLFGRVYHYGFYQAAVAAMVIVAALAADWPRRLDGRWARRIAAAAVLALVSLLAVQEIRRSTAVLELRTLEIGRGPDRMYYLPGRIEPVNEIVRLSADYVDERVGPEERVLILPEGIMINYLARRATPLRTMHFFAGALAEGREAGLVRELRTDPPEWVIVTSRDLREYGVQRYGDTPGHGRQILTWVLENYDAVGTFGNDPLDPNQRGARYFRLKVRPEGPGLRGRMVR
ncbi:MAG: hypothetical protein JSS11_05240 [Verrucomicrobia bacterium]|nr:hypothetical protein [Verrucomicrobiota bacterium]